MTHLFYNIVIECDIKWVWSTCGRLSAGLKAYDQENFLETVDLIESSLPLYREALDRCLLLCEDMLVMNTTEPDMSDGMREILDYYKPALAPDTLDYHSVLTFAVRELLECRVRCHDDVARVRGEVLGQYLPHHFHYLQFSYYKCEHRILYTTRADIFLFPCLFPSPTQAPHF